MSPKPALIDRKTGRKEEIVDENLNTVYSNEELRDGLDKLLIKIQEKLGKSGWEAE